jgi:hypothetical protein
MKTYRIILQLFFFTIMLLFNTCRKDNSLPEIHIIDFRNHGFVNVQDTVQIKYSISNTDVDSVCLLINDSVFASQVRPENIFYFIPESSGNYSIKLSAYRNDGERFTSEVVFIFVNALNTPYLRLVATRLDGNKDFFLGEELLITVEPEWYLDSMKYVKQLSLYLNNDSLGTKYFSPYIFETGPTEQINNVIHIKLTDTAGYIYNIEKQLVVPKNTPPKIEFGFRHYNNLKSGFYYSVNPIIFNINGTDNIITKYVDFYLDSKYIATDSVNTSYYVYRELQVDTISPGKHIAYCIAYDDRGDSTISGKVGFEIYKTIDINDKIIDIVKADDKTLIFAISGSFLYKINPISEDITAKYTLPHQNPTSIDYVNEENKLYIGFKDGNISCFDNSINNFQNLISSVVSNIGDFEIDNDLNLGILISDTSLNLLNLKTEKLISCPTLVYKGSALAIDRINKTIIAGGDPHTSSSWLYKFKYNTDSITLIDKKEIYQFIEEIKLLPDYNEFTIIEKHGSYCYGYEAININDFTLRGKYVSDIPSTGCYSSDGTKFFIGEDFDNNILIYNTNNFKVAGYHYIPLIDYNDVSLMITNADDSKLILATSNVFYEEVKLIFIRL